MNTTTFSEEDWPWTIKVLDLISAEDICVKEADLANFDDENFCCESETSAAEADASCILMDEEDNLRDDLRWEESSSEAFDKYLSCEDARACLAWYSTAS